MFLCGVYIFIDNKKNDMSKILYFNYLLTTYSPNNKKNACKFTKIKRACCLTFNFF